MIHCAAAAGGRSLKIIFYDFRNDRVCIELVLHIRESCVFDVLLFGLPEISNNEDRVTKPASALIITTCQPT